MDKPEVNGTPNGTVSSPSFTFEASLAAANANAAKQDSPPESTPATALVDTEADPQAEDPNLSFTPIIVLPEIHIPSLEEDERPLISTRAKLFRFARDENDDPPEQWKERGVGDIKILQHNESGAIRILMRRDKTLKICANHYITMDMNLKPHCGSDKAFVWSSAADFSDGEPTQELLAARFKTPEIAMEFKKAFDEAKKLVSARYSDKADASEISFRTTATAGSEDEDDNREDPEVSEANSEDDTKENVDDDADDTKPDQQQQATVDVAEKLAAVQLDKGDESEGQKSPSSPQEVSTAL